MLFTLVIVLLTIILIIVSNKLIFKPRKIYNVLRSQGINGEPFVPIYGQIEQLRKYFELEKQMDYQMDLEKKYGNKFILSVGPVINLVITDPDLIGEILTKKSIYYTKPKLFREQFGPVAGSINLVIAEGEIHSYLREMLNPAFHFANLQSLVSIMCRETSNIIERWLNLYSNDYFDIQTEVHALSLCIICSSSFGMKMTNDLTHKLCQSFIEGFNALYYRTNHYPIYQIPILNKLPILKKPIIDKNAHLLRSIAKDMIKKRRSGRTQRSSGENDLLDLLLSAEDKEGKSLTDEQIENESIAFVLAGHETTGSLLAWALYILMTNPQVFIDCRQEVDEVLEGKIPDYNDLQNLHIIDAVVHETLRLYPPVSMIMREAIEEHTLGEGQLQIPLGTGILFNIYNLHRSNKYWSDPFKFDYKRWMRNSKGFKPKLAHPFCYLPFSAGNRNCIGQNFAVLEAKVLIVLVVQKLDLFFKPDQKTVHMNRITLKAKYGIQAKIQQRI